MHLGGETGKLGRDAREMSITPPSFFYCKQQNVVH